MANTLGRRMLIAMGVFCSGYFLVFPLQGNAQEGQTKVITYEFQLEENDLAFDSQQGCDEVSFPESAVIQEPTKPAIPGKTVHFVIDPDKSITNIQLVTDETVDISGDYEICPVKMMAASGAVASDTSLDNAVYGSDAGFPEQRATLANQGFARDIRLASLIVNPLEYRPASKKLILHKKMIFLITQKPDSTISAGGTAAANRNQVYDEWVSALVENPEVLEESYAATTVRLAGVAPAAVPSVGYLIITNNALYSSGAFQNLVNSKARRGMNVIVGTVENIRNSYTGADDQERIRNYIKAMQISNNVTWVLLGGDASIVPARNYVLKYCIGAPPSGNCDPKPLPTDIYYSDLDGNWIPDVFVGRAPIQNDAEARTFVQKVLKYETNVSTYFDRVVLFGGHITPPINSSPGDGAGRIVSEKIAATYLPSSFGITKYYEAPFGSSFMEEARVAINTGLNNLVSHIGHGDWNKLYFGGLLGGNFFLDISDFNEFTNSSAPGILITSGCFPGAFDYVNNPVYGDFLAKHWITNANGGGAAFVGNSRSGGFPPGQEPLLEQFYNQLFRNDLTSIGQTIAAAKMVFSSNTTDPYRLALAEWTLFGDPEMRIMTKREGSLSINNGAEYTRSRLVNLAISLNGSVMSPLGTQMQFSNDAVTWYVLLPFSASKVWGFTSDGLKTVYVRFKDGNGKWSQIYSDTILVDSISPALGAIPFPTVINGVITFNVPVTDAGSGLVSVTMNACQAARTTYNIHCLESVVIPMNNTSDNIFSASINRSWLHTNYGLVFTITANDRAGNSVTTGRYYLQQHAPYNTLTLNVPDLDPPTVPSQLAANIVNGQVSLSWLPSSGGATYYEIYRDADNVMVGGKDHWNIDPKTGRFVNPNPYLIYRDSSLLLGVKYKVQALDEWGNRSGYSVAVAAGTLTLQAGDTVQVVTPAPSPMPSPSPTPLPSQAP